MTQAKRESRALFIAFAITIAFLAVTLYNFGFDAGNFINIGSKYSVASKLPEKLKVIRGGVGYDGEFYYRLALTPFTRRVEDKGIIFDNASYRQQRILYPLFARFLALGNPKHIPEALVAVNFIALLIICFLGVRLAVAMGRDPYFGIVFALFPGYIFSFKRDLTEILAAMFLMLFLLCVVRGKRRGAAIAITLAMLTRETMLLAGVGCFLEEAWRAYRDRKLPSDFFWLFLPPAVFVAVQAALYANWGVLPIVQGGGNLGAPLSGIVGALKWMYHARDVFSVVNYFEYLPILIFPFLMLILCAKDRFRVRLQWAWLLYFVLFACLTHQVLSDEVSLFRATTELFILSVFVFLSRKQAIIDKIFVGLFFFVYLLVAADAAVTEYIFMVRPYLK